MRMVVLIVGSVWLALSNMAQGYELRTHARMTQQAHQRSMLGTSNALLEQLGLRPDDVLGGSEAGAATHYYNFTANTLERRFASTWETDRMPRSGVNDKEHLKNSVTAQGWLLRGAIREDDSYGEDNPQDDPFYPTLRRPLHHFYDPIFDRPLNKVGLSLLDSDVHTAPSWGIGAREPFAASNIAETDRRNHFTIFDAREAMYRALTGKKKDGMDAGPNNTKVTEADRKAYWATAFRALGDVVHLVQDMGQPQHTRNDHHAGKSPQFLTGHTSVYEKYSDARATGESFTTSGGSMLIPRMLDYGSDAIPRFANYTSYFSTRNIHGDILARQGLADYSNRGFFSAGSNIGNFDYPYPVSAASRYGRQDVAANCLGEPLGGTTQLLTGDVPDNLGPSATNQALSAYGLWDEFLEKRNLLPGYSLNCYNYDAMADLLIPRAVAYSAEPPATGRSA